MSNDGLTSHDSAQLQLRFLTCRKPLWSPTPSADVPSAISSQKRQMAWWSWGDPAAPHVVVCVHGLTRQGRDFDVLAQALLAKTQGHIRVVCPDVAGRGRSDWLDAPQNYLIPQYAQDMTELLAFLAQEAPIRRLDWVGTSMGGLIGMALAPFDLGPSGLRLDRLVLNDVGPRIEISSLVRIAENLAFVGPFETWDQAHAELRRRQMGFGPHTQEQWRALNRPMIQQNEAGHFIFHYDPQIATGFKSFTAEHIHNAELLAWQLYDQITAQVLLTRGQTSDLLSPQTALEMTHRGPQAKCVEFAGVGHAPTFVAADQVQTVCEFLLS